jgi:pyridoxal phosphate enzyme (YggS family)
MSHANSPLTYVVVGAAAFALILYRMQRRRRQKKEPVLTEAKPAEDFSPRTAYSEEAMQSVVASNLADVRKRMRAVVVRPHTGCEPVLLAVSKAQPAEALLEAYAAGHRDFAENYVQELCDKVTEMPPDCRWHFVGGLQSNKAKDLVRRCGPLLAVIETVDSANLADKIDYAVASLPEAFVRARRKPLEVMIQVNTSPWEGTKHGVLAADVPALADHIRTRCPNVTLGGLMTIGAPNTPRCFTALCKCRDALATHLKVRPDTLRLSMGMSNDFEQAIAAGSDSVRVGSSIFGGRNYINYTT